MGDGCRGGVVVSSDITDGQSLGSLGELEEYCLRHSGVEYSRVVVGKVGWWDVVWCGRSVYCLALFS